MPRRLAALIGAAWMSVAVAAAQDRATVEDFGVHLFMSETGALSPDVTRMTEFIAFNFSAQAKDFEGGHFQGYLIALRFAAPREIFAKGTQAQIELRSTKPARVLRRFTVRDLYVGDSRVAHYPLFVAGLDCEAVDIVVTSHGRRLARTLTLACGE